MTNLYVFWKKVTDPPSPWTRLTRTNQYLRFSDTLGDHWTQVGAATHTHPTVSGFAVDTSVHSGPGVANTGSGPDDIQGPHNNHAAPGSYSISNNNNNPAGLGLDIIYVDLATWEAEIRSFPEGAVIMSNGALVDAALSRYGDADGKYIYHGEPEVAVGTATPQSHTVAGTLGSASGVSYTTAGMSVNNVGDRSLGHNHTFSLASEAKYVEPRNLVTRLYEATRKTSRAVAGAVVFVDGSVGVNWEILTTWAGGNLKGGDSDPTLSGSDTHPQTFSGNSSVYDGPDAFDNRYSPSIAVNDSHYHPLSGTLDAASHIPSSRLIVPARLLTTVYKKRRFGAPQAIGLW